MKIGSRCVQFLAATSASLSLAVLGTTLGWSSPSLPKLQNDSTMDISNSEGSWIASISSLTAVVATVCVPFTVDILGRKKLLLFSALPVLAHWLMIAFANSFEMLLAARVVASLGTGVMGAVCPMYLAEVSETAIRGALSALYQVMLFGGMFYVYCVGALLPVSSAAFVDIIITALFLVTFVWMPESPYFYMLRGNERDATESLLTLRQKTDAADVKDELETTRKAILQQEEARGSIKDVFLHRGHRNTMLMMAGLTFLQVASGCIALMAYSTDIFLSSGSSLDANTSAIVLAAVQVVASVVSVPLLDRVGRRPLMIWTFLGCGLSQVAEGAYFFMHDVQGSDVSALYWLPLTALIAFQVIFALGIGSVLYVLYGEIFHLSVKGVSASICSVVMSLTSFLVQKLYQIVADASSPAYAFWGFAVICFFGTAYTYILLPETMGRTFPEIYEQMHKETALQKPKQPAVEKLV